MNSTNYFSQFSAETINFVQYPGPEMGKMMKITNILKITN